ncbi:MAG: hypothetical protein R3E95_01390 [Thiolinea sp.]
MKTLQYAWNTAGKIRFHLSHEIRTPLHAMLVDHLVGTHPAFHKQKTTGNPLHYAESMYELVDNLLDRTQAKQAQVTVNHTVTAALAGIHDLPVAHRAEEKQSACTCILKRCPVICSANQWCCDAC